MDYKIKLKHIQESCDIVRLSPDAQGFVTSLILQNFQNRDAVFIAQNDFEMDAIEQQIRFFAPHLADQFEILRFSAWDCMPFDRASPKQMILGERMRSLCKMSHKNGRNVLLLTTINAITQKVVAPSIIKHLGLSIKARTKISIAQIIDFLIFNGYHRNTTAVDAGEFAVRGGIIDIVMNKANNLIGYRVDFFGEEIESIKEFDPLTQLSLELVREVEILPASEVILNDKTCENFRAQYRQIFSQNFNLSNEDPLYEAVSAKRFYEGMEHWLPLFYEEKLVSIFDYLHQPILFFNREIFASTSARWQTVTEYYQSRLESIKESKVSGNIYNPLAPELLYFSDKETQNLITQNTAITFDFSGSEDGLNNANRAIDLDIKTTPSFALAGRTQQRDPLELMKEYISSHKQKPSKALIACLSESSRERLKKLLVEFDLNIDTCLLQINQGFTASDFILIGEQAIFGEKVARRKTNNKAASTRILEEGLAINVGDLVVHRDHGIGKFDGIHTINSGVVKADMLKILYGGSDTLFVPVEDIDLLTRYGDDNPLIQLDRLGIAAWKNRKAKVRNRIKVAAAELIKIAAARKLKTAPAFTPDSFLYEEFKARFGFVETEDQQRAIEEIEEDLERGTPMDRLVCGDVGFGKTEVAMRATFIVASQNNSQVAIIAPTTLLCRQHFHNFSKRFEGTNIKVRQLSRLVSATEQKKIKQELETGATSIVIGTHALLNKTIKFKNLALVIIDEEQHFGVAQKERLKELKNEVHLLTLSATPIPRTLQMSMTGVKDLSLIATPPIDRLAVRNFVMPYDSVIAREAIMREYQRGGKTFFVVPRVSDIREMEDRLKKSIPEIKITHAHGQMTPSELDEIMNNFYEGKIDVLLSTTIIESGIDIASANTIIIYKAEMFGLAQLYQLRGRVGRGKTRGYAYFMLSPRKINKDAKKKLEVMQHLDSLGVGFSVASHDMDIRGSGDLLGDEQSGHIRETGAELYQQMLVEEIERMKNEMKNSSLTICHSSESWNLAPEKEDSCFRRNDNVGGGNCNVGGGNCNVGGGNGDVGGGNADLGGGNGTTDFTPQIKLQISLLIPEEYMPDLALRMSFYKKIAHIKTPEAMETLTSEMIDRFGKMPQEIENLMQISQLKHQCKMLGIERLEATKDGILLSFHNNKFKNPEKLLTLIFANPSKIKLQSNQKVLFCHDFAAKTNKIPNKITTASEIIKKLLAL